MTTSCTQCSSTLDEGRPFCAHCGAAASTNPGVAEAGRADVPAYVPGDGLKGIGGWLILPAIGLAISPFFALHGVFIVDLPILTGSRYETFLTGHPGVAGLLVFELITNAVFLFGSLGLNFLFYKKKRIFPAFMIAYLAVQFFLLLADHIATRALLSSTDGTAGTMAVIRSFVGAAVWIPYFLNSQRVEQTFVN